MNKKPTLRHLLPALSLAGAALAAGAGGASAQGATMNTELGRCVQRVVDSDGGLGPHAEVVHVARGSFTAAIELPGSVVMSSQQALTDGGMFGAIAGGRNNISASADRVEFGETIKGNAQPVSGAVDPNMDQATKEARQKAAADARIAAARIANAAKITCGL